MSDKVKGFIWGVVVVLAFVLCVHACSGTPETPTQQPAATNSDPVDTTGGGTGSGPDGMYNPPNLTIPQVDIPSAPPAAPPIAAEPAQAAPEPAQAVPAQ